MVRPLRLEKALELVEYESHADDRNEAIYNAYKGGGYTQKKIDDYFGLHYTRVSRIIKEAKGKTWNKTVRQQP